MDRKSSSNDPGGGDEPSQQQSRKKGSGGNTGNSASSSSSIQGTNSILPHVLQEPNLAELFAAHNLLASGGIPGHGSSPLALLQQQMNMQYANPAAWWYLEYLSRIQAAQMVPNLQSSGTNSGSNGNNNNTNTSTTASTRPERTERETSHRVGRRGAESENRRKSTSTRSKGKQASSTQPDGGSSHSSLPIPAPPPATHSRNAQGTSRRGSSGASGERDSNSAPTTTRTTNRRGRGGSNAAAAAAATVPTTTTSSHHHQVSPLQLLPMNTSRSSGGSSSSLLSNTPNNLTSRLDQSEPLALNLSKNISKHKSTTCNSTPGCVGVGGESSTNSKSLNLPSSVTIIPHAHSKPDSLTCPRFPSDYVPKPAHMSNPSLYSHTVPKSPQLGLIKGEKVKRKSTVASLLQQSRAAGVTLGGNVEILPKSERLIDSQPPKSIRVSERGGGHDRSLITPHLNNEKLSKAEKAAVVAAATSSNRNASSDRNASPLLIQQQQQPGSCQNQSSQRSTPEKVPLPPTSSTPPHRPWLNTTELNIPQPKPKVEPDLNAPLQSGWKRETLLKGLSPHGLNGEVSYISPNNVTVKSLQELKKVVGNNGIKNYSFSCKLLIGDFLLPGEDGKILKLTSNELANWLKEEAKQNKKEEERVRGERERKKEHAALVRALELFRRSRRRYKLQQERKLKKRVETQPEVEVKPDTVEVDEILVEKKLIELDTIKGLHLGAQAFANSLHIYEFLHTFGNTLGFDMDSLPSLSSLQKAFLHIDENEEELLSVLSHLLVCAVEDPGMPNPNKHMTAFGQTLKQADITFGSLSEVLRLYLSAVSDSEPEAENFSIWLTEAPFLALSPTRKSSIISFICDLLLQNKAVLKHLESSTESAHSSRKERQQNEIKLRRLRMLCARKAVAAVAAENEKCEDEVEGDEVEGEVDSTDKLKSEDVLAINRDKQLKWKMEIDNSIEMKPHYSNGSIIQDDQLLMTPIKKETPLTEGRSTEELLETIDHIHVKNPKIEQDLEPVSSVLSKPIFGPDSTDSSVPSMNLNYLLPSINKFHNSNNHDTPSDCIKIENISNVMDSEDISTKLIDSKSMPVDDDASFLSSSSSSVDSDSDAKLSVDEIRQKMNALQRSTEKLKILQVSSTRVIRSVSLGQDRFRRRYWNLPAAGGIYVEGGASGEFDDIKTRVVGKFLAGEPPIPPETLAVVTQEEADKPKEPFEVSPPCIKIFSFAPREGCSGKTKDLPVKEEEDKREDDNFIKVIDPANWNTWWKLDEKLPKFREDLCTNGIREPALKIALSTLTSTVSLVEEEFDDEEIPSNVQSPIGGWDSDLAYKVHLTLLETLETLEERVASASLQVKGWQIPARPTNDLSEHDIVELVKERLIGLEAAIERRYLKPPLGKSANELNLLTNVAEGGTDIYIGSKALLHWREAINKASTPAVLSMAVYSLDTSIAWDKSVMKASCQLCKGGDHEDKLLLCDACDRGYHTYCFKPPLETIPDGDWFCWECINKAQGTKGCIVCGKGTECGKIVSCDKCPNKAYHIDCIQPQLQKVPRGRWYCPDHKTPTKKRKSESKSESDRDCGSTSGSTKKSSKKLKTEMCWCEKLLDDMMRHEDAWPFLEPVNTRQFPTYKKIIKNPMDLASIRSKMSTYKTKAEFLGDMRLIFDNCLTFNEDDSPVGKAGHNLRNFFEAASSRV